MKLFTACHLTLLFWWLLGDMANVKYSSSSFHKVSVEVPCRSHAWWSTKALQRPSSSLLKAVKSTETLGK